MSELMSIGQPEQIVRPSIEEVGGSIACSICQAIYLPVDAQKLPLFSSSIALEAALMSMCHFCFRCRRPACPLCWDEIHGVCGMCTSEAHLLFRCVSSPLPGTQLPPSQHYQEKHTPEVSNPLICIKAGIFPPPEPAGFLAQPLSERSVEPTTPSLPATSPLPTQSAEGRPPGRIANIGRLIEHMMTIVALAVLLIVLLLITFAMLSVRANTLISLLFRVDIRAEIAYLLLLVRSLH